MAGVVYKYFAFVNVVIVKLKNKHLTWYDIFGGSKSPRRASLLLGGSNSESENFRFGFIKVKRNHQPHFAFVKVKRNHQPLLSI